MYIFFNIPHLGGGQEPGHGAGEGHHDPQEEQHAHALVTRQRPVTHLEEDIDLDKYHHHPHHHHDDHHRYHHRHHPHHHPQ